MQHRGAPSWARNVPQPLLDVGCAFDATERQLFIKFILPASLPYMMTGLRLGVGRAIIGMVVAEFFTAITGLGALIVKYGNQYDTAAMFVPILTSMLLGVTLTALMRRIEASIAPWKDLQGDSSANCSPGPARQWRVSTCGTQADDHHGFRAAHLAG